MGLLSRFEGKMEDTVEGAAERVGGASLSPVQITKKAEKQMRREKIVGAGKQYAPTLYTILVSPDDDRRLFQYYPTLAGETETFLMARAQELGLVMDGQPLVRFISDPDLKRGKFDVVAELVASSIVDQLRDDEMVRYGLAPASSPRRVPQGARQGAGAPQAAAPAPVQRPVAAGAPQMIPIQHEPAEAVEEESGFDGDFIEDDPETVRFKGGQASPAAPPQSGGSVLPEVYLYDEERDRAYHLTGLPQQIGRESSNEINVPDINVSRVHAEIRLDPVSGIWMITDLGSTNGLYINGRKVDSSSLQDADMITLGTTTLEFQDLR